ncbi:hypothetical protein [Nocardia sp. NPDC050710]|uniref:hypothetical protein n=1 Tax=Nocardia sp. NPDC050710 TaxID=3157220 RepID=UPI0033E8976B
MKHPLWERIPTDLRSRVDELITQDLKLQAVKAIRDTVDDPCPGLYECMDLLVERCVELDEPWVRPSPPLHLDDLINQVAALPHIPDVIEALWDGDTNGWFVLLIAVTLQPKTEHDLALIRHGTDLRLFNSDVPPWTEAQEATSIGCALADRLGVPFHFASPDKPDPDPPRWWDDKA